MEKKLSFWLNNIRICRSILWCNNESRWLSMAWDWSMHSRADLIILHGNTEWGQWWRANSWKNSLIMIFPSPQQQTSLFLMLGKRRLQRRGGSYWREYEITFSKVSMENKLHMQCERLWQIYFRATMIIENWHWRTSSRKSKWRKATSFQNI